MRSSRALALAVPAVLGALSLAGCQEASAPGPGAGARSDPSPAAARTPAWPDDVEAPQQGGTYEAVVLASGSGRRLEDVLAAARERGYVAGPSDAGCLDGVADRVPVDGLVAAVLFEAPADATAFRERWSGAGLPVAGTATVRTYCLD